MRRWSWGEAANLALLVAIAVALATGEQQLPGVVLVLLVAGAVLGYVIARSRRRQGHP